MGRLTEREIDRDKKTERQRQAEPETGRQKDSNSPVISGQDRQTDTE